MSTSELLRRDIPQVYIKRKLRNLIENNSWHVFLVLLWNKNLVSELNVKQIYIKLILYIKSKHKSIFCFWNLNLYESYEVDDFSLGTERKVHWNLIFFSNIFSYSFKFLTQRENYNNFFIETVLELWHPFCNIFTHLLRISLSKS